MNDISTKTQIQGYVWAKVRLLEALGLGWLSMGGVLCDLRVWAGSFSPEQP